MVYTGANNLISEMKFASMIATLGLGILSVAPAQEPDSFSLQLFRSVVRENSGNVAISPVGVESVLSTLRQYSAGETQAELAALPMSKNPVEFDISVQQADGMFVAETLPLQPGVKDVVSIDFGRNVEAARTINSWFSEHTKGLIKKLVSPSDLSLLTAFVATNAMYLKAQWMFPFDKSKSFCGEFTTEDGQTVKVNMMSRLDKFPAVRGEDWVAVALPYAASKSTGAPCYFIAICPRGDVREFAAGLTQEKYAGILARLADAGGRKRVIMPSFTIETGALNLNKALKDMGLRTIFAKADFSGLTTSRADIYLSKVLQKCYVKVDEQGTVAAAATAAIANFRSLSPTVVLDRPFIWMITDFSGSTAPLFMGILSRP